MKILVTGGCGFIGSALGNKLALEGHKVILFDSMAHCPSTINVLEEPNIEIVEGYLELDELGDYAHDVDIIYHFGGVSNLALCQLDPKYAYDINVSGTLNVLEIARFRDIPRVVFSSTSAVYENTVMTPHYENDEINPDLVYSMTKKAAEEACFSYARNYGMDISVLRFFNVYGPGQDHTRDNPPLIPSLCHALFSRCSCTIYGDGEQRRDYAYIDDVVDACMKAGFTPDKLGGHIFNIASRTTTSPNMIMEILAKEFDREVPVVYEKSGNMWDNRKELFEGEFPFSKRRVERECVKFTWGDNQKAQKLLGWSPTTLMNEGIVKTARSIKDRYYA